MPATYSNDHEVTIGSTTYPLKLIRDDNGVAMYNVTEDIPEHLDKVLFRQEDFSGGLNQYKFKDPTRYFDGYNIDTTNGYCILGPNIVTTRPSFFITYAYASDNGVFTDQSTAAGNATTNDINLFPAVPVAGEDIYYFGAADKFSRFILDVTTAAAGTYTVAWEIYTTDWTSTPCTTTNMVLTTTGQGKYVDIDTTSWATCEVNSTTAYWLRLRLATGAPSTVPLARRAWAQYATMPTGYVMSVNKFCGFASLGTSSETNMFAEGSMYDGANYTYKIWQWDTASWKEVYSNDYPIYDMIEYDNVLYASRGDYAYVYTSDGITWTESTLTDHEATYFTTAPNADGSGDLLWKANSPNELASTTNGTNAGEQWSTAVYIGDDNYSIDSIFLGAGNQLLITKQDGTLYHYKSDGTTEILLAHTGRHAGITARPCNFQNNSYFCREDCLMELTSYNTVSIMGPLDELSGVISYSGTSSRYFSISADNLYLYVLANTGGTHIIFKGYYKDGSWRWSPFIKPYSTSYVLGISYKSATASMLWWYDSYYETFQYAIVCADPLTDAYRSFNTDDGILRLSYDYGSSEYFDKMVQSVVTETEGCSATVTVTPYYWGNTDSSATALTAAITTNGIVKTNLTSALSKNRYKYELRLATASSASTPILRLFEARGHEKPTTYRVHECTYSMNDTPALKGSTLRTFLRGGRTSTSLIKFADLRFGEYTSGTAGTNYVYVVMEPGFPREVEIYHEKTGTVEMGIQVRFREVNYS